MVDPSTSNDGEAIESGDLLLGEECGEEVTDDTAYTVRCKDIEWVIIVEDEFELCGEIAHGSGNDTESDGCRGTDESRCWSDSDETDNGARAETDDGPFLLETVIPEHPSETCDGCSEIGDDASVCSTHVCREGRTAIEAEPTEPEEDGADDDVGGIVWFVGETFCTVSTTFTEVDGDGECCCS